MPTDDIDFSLFMLAYSGENGHNKRTCKGKVGGNQGQQNNEQGNEGSSRMTGQKRKRGGKQATTTNAENELNSSTV